MKQIMIDSITMSTLILILKKKYIDSHNRKWKKKMIDMHVVNKKKKKTKTKTKKIYRFLQQGKKIIDVHTVNQKK